MELNAHFQSPHHAVIWALLTQFAQNGERDRLGRTMNPSDGNEHAQSHNVKTEGLVARTK